MKNQWKLFAVAAFMTIMGCSGQEVTTVRVADYLTENMASEDALPALRAAIDECIRVGAKVLELPGGELRLKPDFAYEKYLYISNNDPSMKRIAINLENVKGLKISGNGTRLVLSGFMSAFNLENCSDITVDNLSIDYTRTFVSEGEIMACGKGWYDLKFPDSYRVDIQNGCLRFRDEYGTEYPFSSLLEFDTERREVAYHVHDYWIWGKTCEAEKLPSGYFRIKRDDFGDGTVGNIMVLGATARYNPAFILWDCDTFTLSNVNIYHCGGMGVIAQKSRNIELNCVNVEPAPDSGRMISISADATHFVNCGGYIRMIDCVFRNQKDDATNIHGWYMSVDKVVDDHTLLLRWRNSGQYGMDFIEKGMHMALSDNNTLETYAELTVADVKFLNSYYTEVRFNEALPDGVELKHVVAQEGEYPEVLISGCYIGNNRARGLLLGSRGKIVVEKCHFHTPGSAILFEGDGNYWYEQAGVRDVIIRDNLFDNCMYGSATWGSACIATGSGLPDKEHARYNRNIIVQNNVFKGFDSRIVNMYSADGFVFRNNKIIKTDDYPAYGDPDKKFVFTHCDNVDVSDNEES